MIEIIDRELSLEEKIHTIANHYSKKSQWEKTQEEVEELLAELRAASNPFRFEDCVYFADNAWSEIADVIIMCAQLVMQHGKEDTVREQLERTLSNRRREAYEAALEALEKQEAKKVEIKEWSPAICPSCGYELSESAGDGYYKHPTFLERCPNPDCGQRLDWSE